jgi:hypothetical protein
LKPTTKKSHSSKKNRKSASAAQVSNKKRSQSSSASFSIANTKKTTKTVSDNKQTSTIKTQSKPRRLVDTHPKTPQQVKDETSERVMYSALNRFVKAQSITTPTSIEHRNGFPKVQPIAIVYDEMIQEPDKRSDCLFRRDIPEVNIMAPNDMTKLKLGRLLVKIGRAMQGLDADGKVLQGTDAEAAFKVNFENSGEKQSATEILNNLFGEDANLEKKYGPKSKK